jgi:hypothetical protein
MTDGGRGHFAWLAIAAGIGQSILLAGGCAKPVVATKVAPNGKVTVTAGVSLEKSNPAAGKSAAAADNAANEPASESFDAAPAASTSASDSPPNDAAAQATVAAGRSAAGADSAAKPTSEEFVPPSPRKFKVEGPNGALRITYDDLDVKKLLNLDNVVPDVDKKLPSWIKELHGKTVRLRGYMKPGFQANDITQFIFARDTGACCFGPNLRFDYLITVTLPPDKTTVLRDLTPFDVVGKFRIELIQIDERTFVGPYHIDDAILLDK